MNEEKRWISSRLLFSAISEQLAENRQAAFTVTGMSMWPFLCHGRDQVIIEKADMKNLKTGDIILFRMTEEHFVLHRITRLNKTSFQTTGDVNLFRDSEMPYDCIVGKICKIIRKGKTIDCGTVTWHFLSRVWMMLFPIRKQIFSLWSLVRPFIRR